MLECALNSFHHKLDVSSSSEHLDESVATEYLNKEVHQNRDQQTQPLKSVHHRHVGMDRHNAVAPRLDVLLQFGSKHLPNQTFAS